MSSAMLTILSLSISGSVLAVVLFALKPLIKHRVSKAFSYYIWLVVLVRLALPIAAPVNVMDVLFNSPYIATQESLGTPIINDTIPNDTTGNNETHISPNTDTAPNETVGTPAVAASKPTKTFDLWAFVKSNLVWIWAAGAFISLAWFVIAYLRFYSLIKSKNVPALPEDEAIFCGLCKNRRVTLARNDFIKTPMLIGIFHPTIVVPQLAYARNGMGKTLENILYHELTHYQRKDLVYKWLVVFITSLHWFNPLMILVRNEISRACELSCDEAVIRNMTDNDKQTYGDTLLALAANKRLPAGILATTLCERKSELKERLISIMKYKKKTAWIAILSVILALALTGCSVALGASIDKTDETKVINTLSTLPNADGVDAPKSTTTTEASTIASFEIPNGFVHIDAEMPSAPAKATIYKEATAGFPQDKINDLIRIFVGDAQLYDSYTDKPVSTAIAEDRYDDGTSNFEGYTKNTGYDDVLLSIFNGNEYDDINSFSARLRDPAGAGNQFTLAEISGDASDMESICNLLLTTIGVKDFTLTSTTTIADSDDPNKTPNTDVTTRFYYSKVVNGTVCGWPSSIIPPNNDDPFKYVCYRQPETIIVDIDMNGNVVNFSWYNRCQLIDTIGQETELLTSEEILEAFKKGISEMPIWLDQYGFDGKLTCTITRIEFCLVDLPSLHSGEKAPAEYELVPAWNFYGDTTLMIQDMAAEDKLAYSEDLRFIQDECLLTLNAVDGSVIKR